MTQTVKLSVVVPAYNEALGLPIFVPHLLSCLDELKLSYEVIIVNDGSTDDTLVVATELAQQHQQLRILNLSRNFGKEVALTAGVSYASGNAVLMIDADGQHPPELIKDFVAAWQDGNQVVIGVRKSNQKEGFVKRYGSKLFYKLINSSGGTRLIPGATDYRLIDRAVQQEFLKFTEHYRMTRALIDWMGYKRYEIPFDAPARIAGESPYRTKALFGLAYTSFISLSMAPLYAIGYIGVFITLFALALGMFILIEQVILPDPLSLNFTGTAMLGVLTIFLVGIMLLAQGLVAVYLSHIHAQTQNRPLFIVDHENSVRLP